MEDNDRKVGVDIDTVQNEKVLFIVGFLAVVFAFFQFKDWTDVIKLNLVGTSISLTNAVVLFSLLLLSSIYLYALDYIRYDFPFLLNIWFLKYLKFLGHLTYALAIFVYPIVLLILFLTKYVLGLIPNVSIRTTNITFWIGSIIPVLLLSIIRFNSFKEENNRLKEVLSEFRSEYLHSARRFFDLGEYGTSILHSYHALKKVLEVRLFMSYGDVRQMSPLVLFNLAHKKRLLSDSQFVKSKQLRIRHNEIAHGFNNSQREKVSKEEASQTLGWVSKLVYDNKVELEK